MLPHSSPLNETGRARTGLLKGPARFYLGVDHRAIALVERAGLLSPARDPLTWSFSVETRFQVRHTERIPSEASPLYISDRLRTLASKDAMAGSVRMVVDTAGAGIVQALHAGSVKCPVIQVLITPGPAEWTDGDQYRLPHGDLLARVQWALQKRRLGPQVHTGQQDCLMALSLAWWLASRDSGWWN